jgi:hypothetical protein
VAADAPELTEKDFRQWKLIADFRTRLEQAAVGFRHHPSWQHVQRRLQQFDYLSLFLFGLVNPALKSMRALCAASKTRRLQEEVCRAPTSLGAFSEAQHLVDPHLLEELIGSLSRECPGSIPAHPHEAWQLWLARDSSIFPALSRMVWARHGAGKAGCANNAVRLHVSFHLLEDKPVQVAVTPGRVCERKSLREQLLAGAMYVGDRYYGEDYKLMAQLDQQGCRFVLRLRDEAVVTVLQENALSPDELAAGIVSDTWARLGSRKAYYTQRVRVVTLRKASGTLMRLVTNVPPEQMRARDVQVLYRRRWQIECFFRWLKCLLGCRHWLAEGPNGAAIQLYLAIIAGLLLQMVLGRRPNQRLWERLQMYLTGWATLEELMAEVERANALSAKKIGK